jgi:hypothetical protein
VVPLAEEDPSHVRPEATVVRGVRIGVRVGVLVVQAVRRDPENRAALERQRAADREKVLEQLRYFVGPVRVQAVITHADPETDAHPVEEGGQRDGLPRKEEQRGCDRAEVKRHHRGKSNPVDRLVSISSRLVKARIGACHAYPPQHS